MEFARYNLFFYNLCVSFFCFFFSSRRRHTRLQGDWSSDVCSSDLHLIDVLDPKEEVTIARYKDLATTAIGEIVQRKHIPILVGGSMLYISAIIDGLD